MGKIVNILHLSDLHYTRKSGAFDQSVILQAFIEDLRKLCDGPFKPDVIVFSGDLVHAADDDDVYIYLYDDLLAAVSEITRCSEKRIFLCPGNHDAHRQFVSQGVAEHTQLPADLNSIEALNEQYLAGKLESFVANKFRQFFEFRELLGADGLVHHDGMAAVYKVDDLATDIVCLNSAWMTSAGIKVLPKDERRLLLPEAALTKALQKTVSGHRKILVTHHPSTWLSEFSETEFQNSIDGRFDAHLYGHLHMPRPTNLFDMKGRRLVHQSSALYVGRNRHNGYALIRFDIESGHAAVHLRSFFPSPRKEFDEGVDVIGDRGVFYSSEEARKFWLALADRVDRESLRTWLRIDLLPAAQKTFNEGVGDRPVCDVFVPPPMYSKTDEASSPDAGVSVRTETPISLEEMVSSNANYIIYGRPEYGKTTLLQQMAVELIRRCATQQLTVPIIIDFADIKPGRNRIQRLLNGGLLCELNQGSLSQLLDEGLVSILIDDVNFSDSARIKLLREFIDAHPRNRYMFTTAIDVANHVGLLSGDVVMSAEARVSFSHVFLQPFTRRQMRTLVEKWGKSKRVDTDVVLNQLSTEFRSINIPVTAVNGTILLTIYETESDFRPINRASLVERFIEHVLEKRSLREAERKSFDFTNKVHLLAHVAAYMAREDKYVLERDAFAGVMQDYLRQKGFIQDAYELLNIFLECRILTRRSEGRLAFRYRAFLEYFVACQMRFDGEFKAWVLDSKRYLSYINEIQYYAGIGRDDAGLLDLLDERFSELTKKAIAEMQWEPNLARLESFQPPSSDSTTDLISEFERQMEAPPLTAEERDEELEADLPKDADDRQEVFRPRMDNLGHEWTTALLLYSGVLKNMELISDKEKRRHLSNLLISWGAYTLQSLATVPLLAKHRKMRINGVQYEVKAPRHFSEALVARNLYLEWPTSVGRLLTAMLGTEKLEKQLREPTLEEADEPLIATYYRHTLIADLKLGEWPDSLGKLADKLEGSRYLLEALLRKISDLYVFGGPGNGHEKELRRVFAHIASTLRGGSVEDRQRAKTQQLQFVERRALIRRLQIEAQKHKD